MSSQVSWDSILCWLIGRGDYRFKLIVSSSCGKSSSMQWPAEVWHLIDYDINCGVWLDLFASGNTGQVVLCWISEEVPVEGVDAEETWRQTCIAKLSTVWQSKVTKPAQTPLGKGVTVMLRSAWQYLFHQIWGFRSSSDWAIAAHRRETVWFPVPEISIAPPWSLAESVIMLWQSQALLLKTWGQIARREGGFTYFRVKLFLVGFLI